MMLVPLLLVAFVVLVLVFEEKPRRTNRAEPAESRAAIPVKPWSVAVYHDWTWIRRRKR